MLYDKIPVQNSPFRDQTHFKMNYILSSQKGILTGHLIVNQNGTLGQTNIFQFIWEKIKGLFTSLDLTDQQLIEFKALQPLHEGKKWISLDELKDVVALAKKVGLMQQGRAPL